MLLLKSKTMHYSLILILLINLIRVTASSDVLVLTDKDFVAEVKKHDIIMVEFYAPWCGHCQKLAPEYEAAATRLKKNDPPIPLAKVDCTLNDKTCKDQGAAGYPTLTIYRKNVGVKYEGPREADSIVRILRSQVGPSFHELENEAEYEKFIDEDEHSVVGFFENDSKLKDSFLKVADTEHDRFRFAYTSDKELCQKYELSDDILLIQPKHLHSKFEPHYVRYDGNYDTEKIKRFLDKNLNGLCNVRTRENLYTFGKPLIVAYYNVNYLKDPKGTNYYRNRILQVAKEHRRKIYFAISNKDDMYAEIKEYGLEEEYDKRTDKPMVAAHGAYGEKYKMDWEFSVENLKRFAEKLLAGKLKNYMKSEPVPRHNDGPVKILVANNFRDQVDGRDALVEIYAPWCGHCKTLEPVFNRLGEKMKDEDVVVAKIDGTANDLPPGFSASGFPTIYWKPKDGPPIAYNGGRDLGDFIQFIARASTDELKGWSRNGKKRKDKAEL